MIYGKVVLRNGVVIEDGQIPSEKREDVTHMCDALYQMLCEPESIRRPFTIQVGPWVIDATEVVAYSFYENPEEPRDVIDVAAEVKGGEENGQKKRTRKPRA